MQKVIIKHLGPIKELEMEIKDFNLLIGEQATGKSTVAKAIYFFRSIKRHCRIIFASCMILHYIMEMI